MLNAMAKLKPLDRWLQYAKHDDDDDDNNGIEKFITTIAIYEHKICQTTKKHTNESSDELHLIFDGTSIFEDDDVVKSSIVEQNVLDGSISPSDESTSSIFDEDIKEGDEINSSDSMALDVVEYHGDGDTDKSAVDDDDMFYYCDESATTATDVSQEGVSSGKHLIQFDYDLLVTSSTEKPINSILAEFEAQLLKKVGSNLCSNTTHQQERKVMLRHRRRRLVSEEGAASSLKELSSLPNDELVLVESTKCSTTTSSSDIACHQINGYMTAYYDSNISTLVDDDIERQILDTIKSSMDFYVDNENPFDSVDDIVGVNYVGIRDSSMKVSNLVDNNNNTNAPSSSILSQGELAGVIIGCFLGVLISVIITIHWKHSTKKKKKGGTQATDENDEGLDNEYYQGKKSCNNNSGRGTVEAEDELSIIPPVSYNPEPPTAAFSNTTGYSQEMLNTREDDEAWLSTLATETYETEATQKASNTTTPHWQRQYYASRQETIDERDDEEESYY